MDRRWGENEFKKLVAESAAAGELVETSEREAVRRVLSMIDRIGSVTLVAVASTEALERPVSDSIQLTVVVELLSVIRAQTGHAVGDAFAALLASARRAPRRKGRSFRREAARLAALRPSLANLKASLAAIEAISPRRNRAAAPFSRAVLDAVAAAAFVDHAVDQVEQLLAGVARTDRPVARVPLLDLMNFIGRCASFAQRVVTLRLADAGDER